MRNFYIGTTLDSIGRGMGADYATDAQREAAEMQQRLEMARLIQSAAQQQQARAQAQDQFNQELAFRSALAQSQAQQTAAQQAIANELNRRGLDLQSRQIDLTGRHYDDEQALGLRKLAAQLEAARIEYPPERWNQLPAQALPTLFRENAMTNDQNAQAAAQAALYNSRLQAMEAQNEHDVPAWYKSASFDRENVKAANEKAYLQLMNEIAGNPLTSTLVMPGSIELKDASGQVVPRRGFLPVSRSPMLAPTAASPQQPNFKALQELIQAALSAQAGTNRPQTNSVNSVTRFRLVPGQGLFQ